MSDSPPLTWFTEDPTPILIVGGIALIVLFVFLLKTGRGAVLWAMVGVALFMGLALVIDKLVVTDRERVEDVIYQAAAAAEQNDLKAVVAFISPSVPQVKREAELWISRLVIESVSIGSLEVTVDRTTHPPTATARLWYIAQGKWRRGDTVHDRVAGRLKVDLQLEGDRWQVIDYERL